MNIEITNFNSFYIGDGAYALKDEHGRLWVVTHNGIEITNKVCLENEVFESLMNFYMNRILIRTDINKDEEL